MAKVAVVYWSGSGNTQTMAQAVVEGAQGAGAEASLIEADGFGAADVDGYDALIFGCPAMGDEELEDSTFEPMFAAVEGGLGAKKVALFGSYGWGDGGWMRSWEERCAQKGITLAAPSVIANESPDDDAVAACKALGAALA